MKSFAIKISRRGLIQSTLARLQSTARPSTPLTSSVHSKIEIPMKKQRGPTDILQALERTISHDPTAPKYKYHDDPYLIPYSNIQKRKFALAEESGRKTAMWIRAEHASLFQHRVADPIIEEFLPKTVYSDKNSVSEDILRNVIKGGQKPEAIIIYQLLEEQVSDETKQSLLELLCYYNNDEKFPVEFPEEKWFRKAERSQTWKYCPVTDKLFATLKDKNDATAAKAYNAMICGLAKYLKVEAAWSLFQEAEKKGYPITLETYNRLIGIISFLKDGLRERLELLLDIYGKIKTAHSQPNTETLTNSLQLAAAITKHSSAVEVCRDIFTEFHAIDVPPSLSSYYYALMIFYKKVFMEQAIKIIIYELTIRKHIANLLAKKTIPYPIPEQLLILDVLTEIIQTHKIQEHSRRLPIIEKAEAGPQPSSLLREIITDLEGKKEIKIENSLDTSFFTTAMEIAANNLQDPIFANRIHNLLLSNNNYKLIGDGFRESLYYRYYFLIHIKNNTIDEFMRSYYDLIVPHVYTPEPNIMNEILQAVRANDPELATPVLPRLWAHLVQFNFLERKDLVSKALQLMTTHCIPPKDSPIHKMYADAAWTVWNFVMTSRSGRAQQISWTGPILGDVAILCLRANEFLKWTKVINFMFTEQNSIVGPPSAAQIDELFKACLLGGHSECALDLVHYCSDIGFENVASLAYKLHLNLPLVDHQLNRLKSLVDPEVLKVQLEESR